MHKVFNQIPIFKDLEVDVFHKVMYGFQQVVVEKDEFIVRANEPCNFMFIVMHGELQAASEIDCTDFVFETLGQGSVGNHNNFLFLHDAMQVNVQAVKRTHILVLPISLLRVLMEDTD